jgi:hypothetical protein
MSFKEEALAALEVAVEKLIEAKCDEAVEAAFKKIEEVIPGEIDNMILEKVKPEAKAELKKILLAQAEKISDKV